MTLPDQMIDRWAARADPEPGQRTLYWHVLMRDYPEVGDLASQARARLAPFSAGLHFTPDKWLHMTTLVAGPADRLSDQQLQHMAKIAADCLADVSPIPVRLGKILYHREAIMLAVTPADALAPIRAAAVTASHAVTGCTGETAEPWAPNVTIAYSTAEQPAQPIIEALGLRLPARETQIAELQLVIQDGPERAWDWITVAKVKLAGPDTAEHG